jgi:HAD superfamily hydrolase (TIGR01490 family)
VEEVPRLQSPLFAFDDQETFATKDEKVLLRAFAVVHAVRRARVEDADVDPELWEPILLRLEDAEVAEGVVVVPLSVSRVDDEPVGHHGGPYTRVVPAAAFFDLDRTLLRRSSALALAGSFRDRGLITRRQLAKAALMQLLFVARGADATAIQRVAEDGLRILRGSTPDELRDLVASALEPVLKPLVYKEPLALAREHKQRGDSVYIVSAALQEIVDALAEELDFDGALGTICEVENGVYTGHSLRALHHEAKARAVRGLAQEKGFDLLACTAYSDSASDLPFLELVGHPVAVNPDRELRHIAADRGWPVLEVSAREYPHARRRVPPVVFGLPIVLGAAFAYRKRR